MLQVLASLKSQSNGIISGEFYNQVAGAPPGSEVFCAILGRRQQRLVEAWAELHQGELLENWERLQAGQVLYQIVPLKNESRGLGQEDSNKT